MSNILKGLNENRSSWDSNMPGYQGDYGGAENWGRRNKASDENPKIDAMLAQQHAQRQEYEKSGKFWLKLKDSQRHLPAGPFIGKQAANQAAIDLLKKQPELKGNLLITAYGPDETQGVMEYGDTAKGQKMLAKVHHRAADRVTSKKSDTDPQYARKAQQTQDRAWDRLAVKEQGVAEGSNDDFEQAHHNEVEKHIKAYGTPGEYSHRYDAMSNAHNSYLTYPGRKVTINTQKYGDRFGHNVFTKKDKEQGVAEANQLPGTPVVSLSDLTDKDNKKNRYGQTVPKKLKKDDPRVKFHKDEKKGVAEAEQVDSPKFQSAVEKLKQMAQQGPRKTVWDPVKRVYKTVPVQQKKEVNEGFDNYISNAIYDLGHSKQGLDRETFLDELYFYLDAEYGKQVADRAFAHEDDNQFDDWYDQYQSMNQGVAEGSSPFGNKTAGPFASEERAKREASRISKELGVKRYVEKTSDGKYIVVKKQGVAEGSDKLQGTPVVSLADFGDKDNKKNKYGQTVPKKLKKDDPRVKFHKDEKQGVAEGINDDFEQAHHNEVERYIAAHGTPGEYRHKYDDMGRAHNSYLTYPGRTVTINTQQYGGRFGHNVFTKKEKEVDEGYDKWGWHTSVTNGEFMPTKYGNKNYVYLHDLDNESPRGGPQLVTFNKPTHAKKAARQFGGKVVKTDLNTYRIVKPVEQGVEESQIYSGGNKQAGMRWYKPRSAPNQDELDESEKIKGADGKACWKGKRYAGTKDGKDICVPVSKESAIMKGLQLEGNDEEYQTGGGLGTPYPSTYEQETLPYRTKGQKRTQAIAFEDEQLDEKWSEKYKRSIDCNNPKGFSQKAHCQGRKKNK